MKQRVAIARALAYDPEVLLMDEPFAAVDAQTREVLQDELLQIWEKTGKTIIFVTHSIEEAIYLADRVAVMTPSPGIIKEVIEIKLPRPRQDSDIRSSAEFGLVRHKIRDLLQNGDAVTERGQTTNQDVAEAIAPEVAL
jgi:NitT/TauT family transport system ATP-binding protein